MSYRSSTPVFYQGQVSTVKLSMSLISRSATAIAPLDNQPLKACKSPSRAALYSRAFLAQTRAPDTSISSSTTRRWQRLENQCTAICFPLTRCCLWNLFLIKSISMGKAINFSIAIYDIDRTDVIMVWCVRTINIYWIIFWFLESNLRATMPNTSDTTSNT